MLLINLWLDISLHDFYNICVQILVVAFFSTGETKFLSYTMSHSPPATLSKNMSASNNINGPQAARFVFKRQLIWRLGNRLQSLRGYMALIFAMVLQFLATNKGEMLHRVSGGRGSRITLWPVVCLSDSYGSLYWWGHGKTGIVGNICNVSHTLHIMHT